MKKVLITCLVEVDETNKETCPSGNPLEENSLINTIEDDFFLDPVVLLSAVYLPTL
tara:strand:- start:25 stop:192 length:168 start_codon:yes stop_codon:yes gene_type:complete